MSDESEESDGTGVMLARLVVLGMRVILAMRVMLVMGVVSVMLVMSVIGGMVGMVGMGEFSTTAPTNTCSLFAHLPIIETSVFYFSISTPGLVLI